MPLFSSHTTEGISELLEISMRISPDASNRCRAQSFLEFEQNSESDSPTNAPLGFVKQFCSIVLMHLSR